MSFKVLLIYQNTISRFKELADDERGVSPIVATVLIILITVVLAVLVSDGLKSWINELFLKFRSNSGNIK